MANALHQSTRPRLVTTAMAVAIVCLAACHEPDRSAVREVAPATSAYGPDIYTDEGTVLHGDLELLPYTHTIPGMTEDDDPVSFDMVPIPAGEFLMGSPPDEKDRNDDEGPQFRVKMEPFWMGKYEVTLELFELFLREVNANPFYDKPIPKDRIADAVSIPSPAFDQEFVPRKMAINGMNNDSPATYMTQLSARQFTKWLSKRTGVFHRLPTEAEWEYACRSGTTSAYSFGEILVIESKYCWFFENSEFPNGEAGYRDAGLLLSNEWGLHDMHGNVAEWVIDQYDPDHYQKFVGKNVTWRDVIAWPDTEYPRVVRGGHFDSDPEDCRSAARTASDRRWKVSDPDLPQSAWWHTEAIWLGFRIVRPLNEPHEEEKQKFWEPQGQYKADLEKYVLKNDRHIKVLVEPLNELARPRAVRQRNE